MSDRESSLAALRPAERVRLEAFAGLFDRLDASSYMTFAESEETEEVAEAKERAIELVRSPWRREAVKAAVQVFVDEATAAYSRRMSLPDTLLLFQSLPDRADDRIRFLRSVERVVVALILWDELSEDDGTVLVGRWGAFLDPGAR